MAETSIPPIIAAQQQHYVTYYLPTTPLQEDPVATSADIISFQTAMDPQSIAPSGIMTLLESKDVLASAGTTGRRTWEAALHLATLLVSPDWSGQIAGSNIIELGAGTGFLAILCARHLAARHVLATDGSGEVIDDLERNLYLNGLDGHENIDTAVLKWGHSLIEELLNGKATDNGGRQYDVLIGSDLVGEKLSTFNKSANQPLDI